MEPLLIEEPLTGADIELFVAEKATGKIVSAEPFIKGTKDKPFQFDVESKFFATSLDNVLAEFSIPPAKDKAEFYRNIQHSRGYIDSILPKEYCTVVLPAANLDPYYLQTDQARMFGCEEDYNAYTADMNIKPFCEDETLRSCGGHIHVGWKNPMSFNSETYMGTIPKDYLRRMLVKALDLHIGIPSVLQEPNNKRKELYGKAGAYRPKKYGLEYRTISNYYLESKKLTDWVYNSVQKSIDFVNRGEMIEPTMDPIIQNAINHNQREVAAELCRKYQLKIAV